VIKECSSDANQQLMIWWECMPGSTGLQEEEVAKEGGPLQKRSGTALIKMSQKK